MTEEPFEYTSRRGLDHISTVAMVLALNSFPGIHTTESCCGHGQRAFSVWFVADDLECLSPLLAYLSPGTWAEPRQRWHIRVLTDATGQVHFELLGPAGEEGYAEALELAREMLETVVEWTLLVWNFFND